MVYQTELDLKQSNEYKAYMGSLPESEGKNPPISDELLAYLEVGGEVLSRDIPTNLLYEMSILPERGIYRQTTLFREFLHTLHHYHHIQVSIALSKANNEVNLDTVGKIYDRKSRLDSINGIGIKRARLLRAIVTHLAPQAYNGPRISQLGQLAI